MTTPPESCHGWRWKDSHIINNSNAKEATTGFTWNKYCSLLTHDLIISNEEDKSYIIVDIIPSAFIYCAKETPALKTAPSSSSCENG